MPSPNAIEIPNDLAQCQQLIVDLVDRMESMQAQLQALLRARYGPRNEQLQPGQLQLFSRDPDSHDGSDTASQGDPTVPDASKPSKRGHGRKRANRDLPRVSVLYDVAPEDRACPSCQQERQIIGQDVSEQYDYVPSSIQILEHVRVKRICTSCHQHGVTGNKPPQVIEKGAASANMLAYVATCKFVDHLPLNRVESILKRDGASISRSTMCDWMAATASVLRPLYERMKEKILGSQVIWTDDTPVKMQDRQDERNMRNARVWCYLGDEKNPYTVFDFTDSRKRDGPKEFLSGFSGFLQADAFAGYDFIYASQNVREVACWAHARRKFFEALGTNKQLCEQALVQIGKLYAVERDITTASDAERLAARQARSTEVLGELKTWLDRQKVSALPKSPLGKAVTYALNNWDALNTYTASGALTIDNNKSERTLRGTAVGRKNWLFVGSHEGGQTAAVLCTILASAKQHGLHPRAYLADVLARLSSYETDLDALLPDEWKPGT